jgi:hypothetical protein
MPADLWTARVGVPSTPTGAATVIAPAALLVTGTTVTPIPRTEVVQIGSDQSVHAWADTRWGQTEPYAMGTTLGMCL